MVCAVSLLTPNSSAINLSVIRQSSACICRTFSMAEMNVAHPQSFLPFARAFASFVNIFCSRLPSRTPAPTFHVTSLQFSPICSSTWCLHVAALRCDTTSHTDYVQLAAVGLHCRHGSSIGYETAISVNYTGYRELKFCTICGKY